jgi:hypothetical protein
MQREIADLDFMTYAKFNKDMESFFTSIGYAPDKWFISFHGGKRHIYKHSLYGYAVDVFFDKLEMCHTIDFSGRLELDSPTIALSDLLLQKLQIVHLADKDIKDSIVLLREHDIGETDLETINAKHMAKLLASDWGFYHSLTTNLVEVKRSLRDYDVLSDEDRTDVAVKIDKIIAYLENEPKSASWKFRSRIGTRMKWYEEVDDRKPPTKNVGNWS